MKENNKDPPGLWLSAWENTGQGKLGDGEIVIQPFCYRMFIEYCVFSKDFKLICINADCAIVIYLVLK